uniref:Retrovirus-related Pol polyprotein from transposon TNT 1-94 n=1 Tax=Cajanus cajan TaxID=3821 RepID=A0A151RLB0_CAJCA|nr:Retrovirus-related Pol polyprotein from transposon TNT 1-94 [Cajanus cajan]
MDMEASLWHRRLSHISEKGLNCLAKKDVLQGLKIYALQRKNQVMERFKQFHALVERQLGKKLKRIRTDNGDEYYGPFVVWLVLVAGFFYKNLSGTRSKYNKMEFIFYFKNLFLDFLKIN